MIPALLAAPIAQGLLGSIVGGVMNAFTPSVPEPTTSTNFANQLQRATSTMQAASVTNTAGSMQASGWNQMSPTDTHNFLASLSGRHVDATDASGRTISGVVSGVSLAGNHLNLTIGNQNVSLSSLKQISWSTATI